SSNNLAQKVSNIVEQPRANSSCPSNRRSPMCCSVLRKRSTKTLSPSSVAIQYVVSVRYRGCGVECTGYSKTRGKINRCPQKTSTINCWQLQRRGMSPQYAPDGQS